jgi:CubicO group peptidase (beta-lactamase class C family)
MPTPFRAARDLLQAAVRGRVAPCAVVEVGRAGGMAWREAVGSLGYESASPPASVDTVFDLASLTKAIATTTIAMRLVDAGRLRVDDAVGRWIAGWTDADRASVTVLDLLEHASGLPAVRPLYEDGSGRAAIERLIAGTPLVHAPRTRSVYSDLGFMLLGFILEDAGGATLDRQFEDIVSEFGLAADGGVLRFGPVNASTMDVARGVAPTQFDPWRGRLLQGEADDRNGAALGGVAGHTGLFGSVGAVGRFAREILHACLPSSDQRPTIAARATLARFLSRSSVPASSRALGWDTMLPTSSCGTRMSERAVGHTGFTGTSLWIDPAADVYAVLLTNRVHPRAESGELIRNLRRGFHDAVMADVTRANEERRTKNEEARPQR